MLLIYLGPLLTKAQLSQHAEPTHHSAEPSLHAKQKHHGHSSEHSADKHSDPLEHLAHGDCGYCVLLTKLPAM